MKKVIFGILIFLYCSICFGQSTVSERKLSINSSFYRPHYMQKKEFRSVHKYAQTTFAELTKRNNFIEYGVFIGYTLSPWAHKAHIGLITKFYPISFYTKKDSTIPRLNPYLRAEGHLTGSTYNLFRSEIGRYKFITLGAGLSYRINRKLSMQYEAMLNNPRFKIRTHNRHRLGVAFALR
ncbi:MAG: hypothetical protein ACI8QD_002285 [Cyclobacteriaceae bacterium]|jgi:hypothetical protein